MTMEHLQAWTGTESSFESVDQTRIFFRAWQPLAPRAGGEQRALVFLHRGHEHSGRIQTLVEQFGCTNDYAFAWDARGHGYSPGERGDAPGFATLVQDFDAFVAHIQNQYGLGLDNIVVVANSVGAVIAAAWLHDYGRRVRGVIMAAAAFHIKLYVPLAKPALRLGLRINPKLAVTSYIRSSMLTHSKEQAALYDSDPLIAKSISARVLLELADTAQRVVSAAAAIDTPVLMLVAGKDVVVSQAPQQTFFARLSSKLKRYVLLEDSYHAIFHESDTAQALDASRQFIAECFAQPIGGAERDINADSAGASAAQYTSMLAGTGMAVPKRLWYGVQKQMLQVLGPLSEGMRIGLAHGFDSGASLDYVYRNKAHGRLLFGKAMDRAYLDAVGWRGIRLRKMHLQQSLEKLIAGHPDNVPLRILDVATGSGRYVLETVKRFQHKQIEVCLRDLDNGNLMQAKALAESMQLQAKVSYEVKDAFDAPSYPADAGKFDIAIVSGLYELFSANAPVLRSLQAIAGCLNDGGHLVYTAQPWHPQLETIAHTLNDHRGKPWVMRPRPQSEIDGLVSAAGLHKESTHIGLEGIFNVSVARKRARLAAAG